MVATEEARGAGAPALPDPRAWAWARQGRAVRPGARDIVIGAPSRRAAGGVRIYRVLVFDLIRHERPGRGDRVRDGRNYG